MLLSGEINRVPRASCSKQNTRGGVAVYFMRLIQRSIWVFTVANGAGPNSNRKVWKASGVKSSPSASCEIGRASCRERVCQYV